MRKFWTIDISQSTVAMELFSKTPRDAALKAATRDETDIYLVDVDTGKLHVFRGERRPLEPHEHTAYTRARNISAKPVVSKMAYRNLQCKIDRWDLEKVTMQFNQMIH